MDVAHFSTGNVTQLLYKFKPLLVFANTPGDAERLIGTITYIKKVWRENRTPKVGTLAYEASTSRQGEDPRLFAMAKEKGVEFLPFDYFPFTATDFSTELRRIHEEKKADFVWLRGQPAQVGAIMKDVVRLGLKDKMKWIACYFGYNEIVPQIAGLEAVNGMLAEWNFSSDVEDLRGVKFSRELYTRYKRGAESPFLSYQSGTHLGTVAHEATRRALEKVGIKKLGGRAIADAVWSLENFDVGGLTPPITMEQGNISLVRSVRIGQVDKEGKLRPISDWMPTPWILGR